LNGGMKMFSDNWLVNILLGIVFVFVIVPLINMILRRVGLPEVFGDHGSKKRK